MESTKRCFWILAAVSATITTLIFSYGFYGQENTSQVDRNATTAVAPAHQENTILGQNVIVHYETSKQKFRENIKAVEKRSEVLVNYCKEKPSAEKAAQRPKAFYHWLFTNDDLNLIACVIPKVGSVYMSRLASPDHRYNDFLLTKDRPILSKYSEEEKRKRIKSYFKVLFVRHPYHRLWSAYTSKFLLKMSAFRSIAHSIIRVTTNKLTNSDRKCFPSVTFKEFITYIIEMHRQKNKLNYHWIMYHDICSPCTMPYDFIGKMESFDEDVKVMIHKLGISKEIHDRWTHVDSRLEAKVDAGCRLVNKINCHTKHEVVLVNFNNLATNGLVDPVVDKKSLLPKIEDWLSAQSNISLLCAKEINRLLGRYPENERAKIVDARKARARNEAFSNLPRDLIEKLGVMYEPDIVAFGYDPAQF